MELETGTEKGFFGMQGAGNQMRRLIHKRVAGSSDRRFGRRVYWVSAFSLSYFQTFIFRIGLKPEDVAIITFYRAQTELVQHIIRQRNYSDGGKLEGLEVKNVDGFQVNRILQG